MPGIPVRPMLAVTGQPADVVGDEWSVEMKWDGVRAICQVHAGQGRLWSRTGKTLTETFPELSVELAEACPGDDTILDAEIVALDGAGRPDFGRLQSRLGVTAPAKVRSASARVPVNLMVFDLLRLDGRQTTRQPYRERRLALEETLRPNRVIHVPPAFRGRLIDALHTSEQNGLEGVVAKRNESAYRPGRRSPDWLKIKHVRTQEVLVAGWRPGNGRRAASVGSLLLAVPDEAGVLRYVGRVGTGFTDGELDEMRSAFTTSPDLARLAHRQVSR